MSLQLVKNQPLKSISLFKTINAIENGVQGSMMKTLFLFSFFLLKKKKRRGRRKNSFIFIYLFYRCMRKVNKQQIKAKAKQSLKEDLCRW
jgi:F0F1-type ATP synthase membrane subunit a